MPNIGSKLGELLRDLAGAGALVRRVWRQVGVEYLAHHQDVVRSAQRVGDTMKTGSKTQSECAPVAWFVLDPSKPH
jgi:hypothetical protein